MNLREVRQAAEYVQSIIAGWGHHPSLAPELREMVDEWRSKLLMQSTHILATIDPSPDLPITAEWLREEWGFKKAEWSRRIAYENGHAIMLNVYDNCWNYEDDNFEWPHKLTTRQQFADLARCLGIPRRKDGAR